MTKGERELRKLLKSYPDARIEKRGRNGYVLRSGDRTMNVGGLQAQLSDRHKIVSFLETP